MAAAIREVREESTIDDLEFAWGATSTQTGPYSGGKVADTTGCNPGGSTSACRSIR